MIWTTRPRSDFGGLRAVREGVGPTIVLLHGVGLRAEAWNAQIDMLKGRFRIIAPDMPGHGESVAFAHQGTLADYSDAIAEAADGPFCVLGHSMGAMIALDLAIRFPEKIRGVIALNAIFQRSQAATAAVHQRAQALSADSVPDPAGPLQRWFADTTTSPARACRQWLQDVPPAGYKAAYSVFAHENGPAPESLATLPCPALFITGSAEPNSTPAMSHAMAALAPKGHAIIIEGAAHMMPMTHPETLDPILSQCLATWSP